MALILDSHEPAPNGISTGLAVFAHLTHGPNTQTDRQSTFRATSVAIRHIGHTYALCRRCGLKMHGSMLGLCLKLKLISGVMRSFAELLWTLVYLINIKSIL